MDFIESSKKLYNKILRTDFSNVDLSDDESFLGSLSLPTDKYSREAFMKYYRKEVESIINETLYPIIESEETIKEIKDNYFYDEGAPIYSLMYLFWIWHNEINFSSAELTKLIQGIFMGTMGYRMMDMYTDDESSRKELIHLGNYLIRSFENSFNKVLGLENSYEIINFYAMRYAEIEYKEKNNRWKNCPFSWEEVHTLGYKTGPLISIIQALYKYAGVDEKKSEENINAFLIFLAANQLVDDVFDALSDLRVGRETLVMEGFYNLHGYNKTITQEQVDEFLTQERLYKVYNTRKSMIKKSTEIYVKNGDDILLLWVELSKLKRVELFEFVEINN